MCVCVFVAHMRNAYAFRPAHLQYVFVRCSWRFLAPKLFVSVVNSSQHSTRMQTRVSTCLPVVPGCALEPEGGLFVVRLGYTNTHNLCTSRRTGVCYMRCVMPVVSSTKQPVICVNNRKLTE